MISSTEKLKVVLFSGGRGCASMARALNRDTQIELTVLVNAYDDGLSTGRLRRYLPGMLGPSDIRKNICTLMPTCQRSLSALSHLLEYRLPQDTTPAVGQNSLLIFTGDKALLTPNAIRKEYEHLEIQQVVTLANWSEQFLRYEQELTSQGNCFDYADTAVGNLLFTGCYLSVGRDFNRATQAFSSFCEVSSNILNVSDGSGYVLCAIKEDGRFLPDEASIVSPQDNTPIQELFLLEQYLNEEEASQLFQLNISDRRYFLKERTKVPDSNPRAIDALHSADLIIYGPGTQHSSLLPSYLTRGIGEAILTNSKAEKVFVGNIAYDHDIPMRFVHHLLEGLQYYLARKGELQFELTSAVTRLFVQAPDRALIRQRQDSSYLPFDVEHISLPPHAVTAIDWEDNLGHHSGGRIVDELLQVAEQLARVRLKSHRHTVSIIVPVLDEIRTLGLVLDSLHRLSLDSFQVNKEIIVVDGGSKDGSFERVQKELCVHLYQLPADKRGRGEAIRLGLSKAKGDIVVIFPADGEYSCDDIEKVIAPIISHQFQVVFGTRAITWEKLDSTLQQIHGHDYIGRAVSKYGGLIVSTTCLVLYQRFISDPFTTLKAMDTRLAKKMYLRAKGVDLETEIIAKARQAGQYILEVPVSYKPRRRSEGKKTGVRDGIFALYRLIRCRFRPQTWQDSNPVNIVFAVWSAVVLLCYFKQFLPYVKPMLHILGLL